MNKYKYKFHCIKGILYDIMKLGGGAFNLKNPPYLFKGKIRL